jgi:hypothetical protein
MKRRPARYEILIVSAVVILAVVLAAALYSGRTKIYNSRCLINELQSMRLALEVYVKINKAFPSDLNSLMKSTYEPSAGTRRPYLEKIAADKQGRPIDPFGNLYEYDSKTGLIHSRTRGYESW